MRYSIILTVHNDEKRLPDCAAALLAQPCQDLEILLVEYGSSDGSQMLCQGYQAAYPERVRAIVSGSGDTRNEGIRCARGAYLLFLDCGMVLRNDALALLSDQIEGSRSDLYLLETRETGSGEPRTLEQEPELLLEAAKKPAALWRRQLFDDAYLRFPEESGYAQERMLCKGMARSRSIVRVPQNIFRSIAPPEEKTPERELAVLDALDDVRSYLVRHGLLDCCRASLCRLSALLICDRACAVLTNKQDTACLSECIQYLQGRFPDYRSISMPQWRGCQTEKLLELRAQGRWTRLRMTCLVRGRDGEERKQTTPQRGRTKG